MEFETHFTIRERRRLKSTSTNTEATRLPFGENSRRLLPIPNVIDAYKQNMNVVDSIDQSRATFDAQMYIRRNRVSVYQFILDVALVNTVAVTEMQHWSHPSTSTTQISNNLLETCSKKRWLDVRGKRWSAATIYHTCTPELCRTYYGSTSESTFFKIYACYSASQKTYDMYTI